MLQAFATLILGARGRSNIFRCLHPFELLNKHLPHNTCHQPVIFCHVAQAKVELRLYEAMPSKVAALFTAEESDIEPNWCCASYCPCSACEAAVEVRPLMQGWQFRMAFYKCNAPRVQLICPRTHADGQKRSNSVREDPDVFDL